MRKLRLCVCKNLHKFLDSDGDWDGVYDESYEYIIYDEEGIEVDGMDGYDTEEAARKAGEEKLKEKEYPKTYEECCKVMGINPHNELCVESPEDYTDDYENKLFDKVNALHKLLICRDAYWKIAGEEMGLGESWAPDWDDDEWPDMYYISCDGKHLAKEKGYPCCNMVLIFPTEEMRDAFYENFKEEIEQCKELL